jgi:hypothetical protein
MKKKKSLLKEAYEFSMDRSFSEDIKAWRESGGLKEAYPFDNPEAQPWGDTSTSSDWKEGDDIDQHPDVIAGERAYNAEVDRRIASKAPSLSDTAATIGSSLSKVHGYIDHQQRMGQKLTQSQREAFNRVTKSIRQAQRELEGLF